MATQFMEHGTRMMLQGSGWMKYGQKVDEKHSGS